MSAPEDPIVVFLTLTSDLSSIAAVGSRLEYDASRVTLTGSVQQAATFPVPWRFVYLDVRAPGLIDVAMLDMSESATTINAPVDMDVISLVFSRNDDNPAPVTFDFSEEPPASGPERAAFPENHYVIAIETPLVVEVAATASVVGPQTPSSPPPFKRGDSNGDGRVDISDAIAGLLYMFRGVPLRCHKGGDADDSGDLTIGDSIFLLGAIFRGEGPIPPPFPDCGLDPHEDALSCESNDCLP